MIKINFAVEAEKQLFTQRSELIDLTSLFLPLPDSLLPPIYLFYLLVSSSSFCLVYNSSHSIFFHSTFQQILPYILLWVNYALNYKFSLPNNQIIFISSPPPIYLFYLTKHKRNEKDK